MYLVKSCSFLLLLLWYSSLLFSQDTTVLRDSVPKDSTIIKDSLSLKDSVMAYNIPPVKINKINWRSILQKNTTINFTSVSQNFLEKERQHSSREFLFYLILGIFFYFGLLKLIYNRYIGILFRVFFNTSLRQSQLTDQLLQAKLPSLLLNLFFCMMGGLYTFILLLFYGLIEEHQTHLIWMLMLVLAIIYVGKFIVLKFTGWVSGYKNEVDSYIFIVFLISKILAIILMPVILIIAFADKQIAYVTIILSYFIIILLYFLRYLRSYSVLQKRLSIHRLHFLLYILGVEIIPLMLLYKIAERLLTNYL